MPIDPIKKNNVHIIGNPDAENTIIFAHGFGTDQTAWHPVAKSFLNDFRVILYDNAGAGHSAPEAYSKNKYSTLYSYAEDLIDISLKMDIKNAILVTHSVSGMISLLASNKRPDLFSKIAMVGASPRYLNDEGYIGGFRQEDLDELYQQMSTNYFSWVSGFSAMAMENPDKPGLALSFAQTLNEIRPDIALSVVKVIFQSDHRKELPKVSKPTLILQTKHDIAVPGFVAEYLNQHIQGSRMIELDAQGHFPHISAPETVIEALHPFIYS